MKRIFTFADIDMNLITAKRLPPEPGAEPIATDHKGAICGYLTRKQRLLFDWLSATTRMIPTTARSSEALGRVRLPFNDYAIVSFGGIILTPERQPESRWYALMQAQAHQHGDELNGLVEAVERYTRDHQIDARKRIVTDFDLPLYLSVKHNSRKKHELEAVRDMVARQVTAGWKVALNYNDLAVLPPYLRKEKAVGFTVENIIADPDALILGSGDSLSDVQFMSVAQMALMPVDSQAFTALAKEAGL